jgi:subtilase family serine protease
MRRVLIGAVIIVAIAAFTFAFFRTRAGCNFLRERGAYKGCCPGDLPDLVAHSHAYPLCHLPGPTETTVSIYFEVKNQGCTDAGPFTVVLSDTQGNPLQQVTTRVNSLAAGATAVLAVPRPIGWCGGHDCQVKINIDSKNEVAEANEGNNVSFELCRQ